MATHAHQPGGFHGPPSWAASAAVGALAGLLVSLLAPGVYAAGVPVVPLWLAAPFALLLLAVALMPFAAPAFWHRRYPEIALFLGGLVSAYFIAAYRAPGPHGGAYGAGTMLHTAVEYYSFLGLVGGLYVASGGIVVEVRGRGGPLANTLLLAAGAVLANAVGTTGASVLLVRPFMRLNAGRLTPTHLVFFILIVSNCGGCLTPIGDPPLYLGYLKGVPFFWTLEQLWRDWLLVVGGLLAAFFLYDRSAGRSPGAGGPSAGPEAGRAGGRAGVRVLGAGSILGLVLLVGGAFIDPMLAATPLAGWPVGATFQILTAAATYALADPRARHANGFTFEPIKEVGLLFAGIFATMAPALAYLAANGKSLGLASPTAFYAGAGGLSAVLDNAPTYLNFLQIAVGREIDAVSMKELLVSPTGAHVLHAISTAAVYFGALTYIGNGPNFMVKAIAEASGVRMPSFFGYLGRALLILGPVLVLHWAVFIR